MAQDSDPSRLPGGDLEPAGFWIRAGAFFIDAVALGIPQSALAVLLGFGLPYFLVVFLAACLAAAYFTLMTSLRRGQTLGKMAAGIAVVRTDGSPVSPGRALLRWLGYVASAMPAFLGLAAAAVTRDKRALHDFIADTRVVFRGPVPRVRRLAVSAVAALPALAFAAGVAMLFVNPKLGRLESLAGEDATRLNLKSLRAGLAAHHQDAAGRYPSDPRALVPRYVKAIDPARTAQHAPGTEIEIYSGEVCAGAGSRDEEVRGDRLRDTGRWGYVADPAAPCYGHIFVDCTHADSRGTPWYLY